MIHDHYRDWLSLAGNLTRMPAAPAAARIGLEAADPWQSITAVWRRRPRRPGAGRSGIITGSPS